MQKKAIRSLNFLIIMTSLEYKQLILPGEAKVKIIWHSFVLIPNLFHFQWLSGFYCLRPWT